MKHNMQEMTEAELEAILGGGFWADFLGAIGGFLDWAIDALRTAGNKIGEIYKQYHADEQPGL